jgi:hypothetical protein
MRFPKRQGPERSFRVDAILASPPVQAVLSVLAGLGASTAFLLLLMIGFSVVFGLPKLRKAGGETLTVRSLDERLGTTMEYLPPTAPRGPADQLHTPELQEAAARKHA